MKTKTANSNKVSGSPATSHLVLQKTLLVCGILASLVWLGTDIIASMCYEGYNYPFEPISGLSAIGSPIRQFIILPIMIYITLKIAFAFGVWISAGQARSLRITAGLIFASGIIDMAASFFPLNLSEALVTFANVMHAILAGGVTVLLIFLTIVFGASADGKGFRCYSFVTLLVFIVSGTLQFLVTNLNMSDLSGEWVGLLEWIGLAERINAYGYMIWLIVLAIILFRMQQKSSRV